MAPAFAAVASQFRGESITITIIIIGSSEFG